ncbi:unnamed protein product [Urochloa humidicola]
MRPIISSVLIVATAVIALCSVAPSVAAHNVGGWNPIKDVNDPHIQELGAWAVAEHVKKANDGLRFGKVVSGEEQAVSGMNCKLVIEATGRDGKSGTYEAAVYEEEWTKKRQLLAFEPTN